MDSEVLELILRDPSSVDFIVDNMPEKTELDENEEASMRRLGALCAYACEGGKVYARVIMPNDTDKPFKFMINPAPDKDVPFEDAWLTMKDPDNGPRIRLHSAEEMPDANLAVAYTSKEMMRNNEAIDPDETMPIKLITLMYFIAETDMVTGLLINVNTDSVCYIARDQCALIWKSFINDGLI